ncbi:crossover junction endodeoxyribonuclease RuvC [Patulibacter sp. S7RM1-6]
MVTVLGIDPGLANTGFGVVRRQGGAYVALDGGVITTAAGDDLAARLQRIHRVVGDLLDHFRPEALAMESLYFGRNTSSALVVGQARGVVLLAAAQRGVTCLDYTPQQIKGAVCGSGGADKAQVQRMVQTLLRLAEPPRPDHAADALAAAICHANHAPLRSALPA